MPDIVLIAGCSSGIGLATAKHLASDQLKRFLVYATVLQPLDEEEEFRTTMSNLLDVTVFPIQMDITNDETITRAISHVMSKHERIDILINIPGVGSHDLTEAISKSTMKHVFDINFFGIVRVTQQVLPVMKKQRSGRIISMGSVHGLCALPYKALYGASKQALVGFFQEVATVCRFFDIKVSVIEPGRVETRLFQNLGGIDQIQSHPELDDIDRTLTKCYSDPEVYHPSLLSDAGTQQPSDIAELIMEVATTEKPHFRYQTSPGGRAMADRIFKDITGDSMIEDQVQELKKFVAHLDKKTEID